MNIILPILFFAVVMGLFVRQMTAKHWVGLAAWIMLVVAHAYLKS